LRKVSETLDVYGRFDGHLSFAAHELGFANNGSRFGLKAEQSLGSGFALFGAGEWSIKLGEGDNRYHLEQNPDTGFGTIATTQSSAIGTRLGFVGLRLAAYGTLTLGKQWSVYYDVSQWTDRYTVFGATGSSTFNAGTDGGQMGTGRANDAVSYRAELGPFRLGVMAQFRAATPSLLDSLAGSLSYETSFGLRAGIAYSHALLEASPVVLVGFDGNGADALTFGVSYSDERWVLASVNTWTRNHEAVSLAEGAIVYDTLGSELFIARKFLGRVLSYAGFDLAVARHLPTPQLATMQLAMQGVDPNYGTRDVLFGARWLFDAAGLSYAYVEGRTGASIAADGAPAPTVLTLGLRLCYSLRDALGD